MKKYLGKQQTNMIDMLEKLVNIDSGSQEKAGIDQVGAILANKYKELGFVIDTFEEEERGNHLVIRHKDAIDPKVILLAHMDTVFATGTVAERPFSIEGDQAFGPGVIDMKGSHVALYYSVLALIEENSDAIKNIEIVLNSDEEIGSATSRALIEEKAQGKQYALVMEPARKDGSLVTARRGGGGYTLNIKGKAAHSGIEPENGRSAIEEMAHKIIKLHQLSNHDEGVSVNVGVVEGGTTVNTIAPHATAHVDLRISTMEQGPILKQQVEDICNTPDVEGTSIDFTGDLGRPPMMKTEETVELLDIIKKEGEKIGLEITDIATGGGSDASFTSALGIPTVDGMGPIGGGAHSEDEYLEIPSLVERTHLLAKVIHKISENN